MKTKKIRAREGDVFAIPLRDSGYAIGLIARENKKMTLGYFFNKIYPEAPEEVPASDLDLANVIHIAKFSSLGIEEGVWPVLKSPFVFKREEWPMPVFQMYDSLRKIYLAVVYDETLLHDKRHVIPEEEAKLLFESGLQGYGFVEARLTRLLQAGSGT